MKRLVIARDDIPEWDYGDVTIKKFSFGGKMRISGLVNTTSVNKDQVVFKERDINNLEISVTSLGEGVVSVKDKDNYEFVIKPESSFEDKKNFFSGDNISFEAGMYLLTQVKDFNKGVTDEEKKN